MLIFHKGHTDTIQVYSVTVMTHVKALQAGHSSQGTSEPITPVLILMTLRKKLLLLLFAFDWFCLLLIDSVCFCLLLIDSVCFCLLLIDSVCFCLLLIDSVCFCLLLIDSVCFCLLLNDSVCFCLLLFASVCFWLIRLGLFYLIIIMRNFQNFLETCKLGGSDRYETAPTCPCMLLLQLVYTF